MALAVNAGFSIHETVTLPPPLSPSTAPMGVILARVKAIIDKTYLTFVDLPKLQAAFPERVSIVDDTVTLAGPVLIIPEFSPLKRAVTQVLAFTVLAAACYIYMRMVERVRRTSIITLNPHRAPAPDRQYKLISALGACLIAGGTVWAGSKLFSRLIGVHFLKPMMLK